jgi:IS30 family transposase
MCYTRLTQEQRSQIYDLLKIGYNGTEIAKVLGSNRSTIRRELWRNYRQRGDRLKQVHFLAIGRRYWISEQSIEVNTCEMRKI